MEAYSKLLINERTIQIRQPVNFLIFVEFIFFPLL